jgi:heavy metal sensor kinase
MSSKSGVSFLRRTDVKLTLLYVVTFCFSALLICGFLYLRLHRQLIKEVDRLLLDETGELSNVLSKNLNEVKPLKDFEIGVSTRSNYPIHFGVLQAEGSPVYTSRGFEEIGSRINEKAIADARDGKKTLETIRTPGRRTPFRVLSTPIYRDGRLVYIAQLGTHLRFVRKSLSNFKRNILIALPIILVLGSLGGWLLARKSLMPLGYIVAKTRSITSKNLSERLTPRGTGDEMDQLVQTINGMIERLEDSFEKMTEFTADASHELKTPLCAMRGEAEVLLSKRRSPEEYAEGLAHLVDRFDHLNRLINDLTLLSEADSYPVRLEMSSLRLDLLIQNIGNLFQILAEQKEILFEVGPLQEITVLGDRTRLQQLFTNLLDNAIKYTPRGSIRISLEETDGTAIAKVKDTGVGIPEQEKDKIFKRFYRVDKSRSRETGGVGLGLSIAQWIAHAHNGGIEVISELDKGSTFIVHLPLHHTSGGCNPS